MKAFVIKNKEGKYLISIDSNHKGHFGKDLFSAEKFHCKGNAKDFCPKDCEVVEVTIAEGDLEKAIRHQICAEIRDKGLTDQIDEVKGVFISYQTLNKIEQGE